MGERVTNAVLATKLDGLAVDVLNLRAEVREWRGDHEQRLRVLEESSVRHQEKLNQRTGLLMVSQLVGNVIAGWLGISR